MLTLVAVGVLFLLIFVGVPIAFSLGVASLVYVAIIPDIPNEVLIQRFVRGPDSFELIAVPMFILAGAILNNCGATKRLVDFATAVIGHIRGGLAQTTILASMLFSGLSGSANADIAGIGKVLIKGMIDEGYEPDFAAAVTGSASCIGPIIPPSTTFILFGAIALVPIGDLLIAGAVPGILMGILMMIATAFIARKRNYPRHNHFSGQRLWETFKESWAVLLTPVIIIGGILSGIFTATEAGVVVALYSFILATFVYKEFKIKDIWKVIAETVYTTSMVVFLLSAGLAFSWVLTRERLPYYLIEYLGSVSHNPSVILLLLGFLMLLLGMFFSVTTNLIMIVPLIMPLVANLGVNPVHFGVITVLALTLGCVTPPVGAPMFIAAQFAGITIGEFARANIIYYIALILALVIVILVPEVSLWLPSLVIR